jgi:hypothetical protein
MGGPFVMPEGDPLMKWFVYRRQVAVNQAGDLVASGALPAFDVYDADFSDPLPVRRLSVVPGSGTGVLLTNNLVVVEQYATIEFECERPEVYLKSGSAPPIHVESSVQQWAGDALKHRGDYTVGAVYFPNDLFDHGGVTWRTLEMFIASATLPTVDTAQYKALGGVAGNQMTIEAGTGISFQVVNGKLQISATGGGGTIDTSLLVLKADDYRPIRRTGTNFDGPWPARPTGYLGVEWIGVAPDPLDMRAGDIRTEPA